PCEMLTRTPNYHIYETLKGETPHAKNCCGFGWYKWSYAGADSYTFDRAGGQCVQLVMEWSSLT
ncbi:hypothetical protein BaRGS_00037011, partial [Batillaria attramentaria]